MVYTGARSGAQFEPVTLDGNEGWIAIQRREVDDLKAQLASQGARILKLRDALSLYRGIAGSDCAHSVTQYSAADVALAEDDRLKEKAE